MCGVAFGFFFANGTMIDRLYRCAEKRVEERAQQPGERNECEDRQEVSAGGEDACKSTDEC